MSDALVFINEAIEALTTEAYDMPPMTGGLVPCEKIRSPISMDLDRIDRSLGHPVFRYLAERINQAVIALHAAKESIDNSRGE